MVIFPVKIKIRLIIGADIDVDFCDIMRQSYFTIITKNAKAGEKERFYKIVRETLEGIVKNGIDKKAQFLNSHLLPENLLSNSHPSI